MHHNKLIKTAGLARLLGLFSFIYLCSPSIVFSTPPAPSPYSFYERYIGIDGACAWPSLHLLPNGDLSVLVWPLDVHGVVEGSVETWISRDHGLTWQKAGIPVLNKTGVGRMNVAAGVIDGNLVALVGGFGYGRPPYEKNARFWGSETLNFHRSNYRAIPAVPAISRDSGVTWTQHGELSQTARASGRGYMLPYGRILELDNGDIGAMLYGDGVYFYTSADKGITWAQKGTLDGHVPNARYGGIYNETTWVSLKNGDLYAVARSFPKTELLEGTVLDGYRSVDQGVTWIKEQSLALPNQIPADLMHMPDGRLLLTYSSRNPGSRGIWFRIGSQDARYWSAPTLLVDLGESTETQYLNDPKHKDSNLSADSGYPSTVLAADGAYVTVYYVRGIPSHQRYHMGVVRWRLPESLSTAYTR
jgi:hypothetical protein